MFRFVRRKSREQLLIDMYEAQLREKERILQLLVEQVEYLRAQLNSPTNTVSRAAQLPKLDFDLTGLPDEITREITGVIADEEEELLAMKQAGMLNEVEYEAALERLRGPQDIIE